MLKFFLLALALGAARVTSDSGVLLVEEGKSLSGNAAVSGSESNAVVNVNGKADVKSDDATTPSTKPESTTAAVIIESAKGKSVPHYMVPGIVLALKKVSSLYMNLI
jgi:hypothetical protein